MPAGIPSCGDWARVGTILLGSEHGFQAVGPSTSIATSGFLELNANANRGFVEVESGLAIGGALAELLHRG